MKAVSTKLPEVLVIENLASADHRGSFTRFFCDRELASVLGNRRIVQINHSRTSVPGSIRGLHYQRPPHAEMKLVRCLKGRVWDVAIDLRAGSSTLLRWHAEELSPENGRMLVVPEGCAHGFQVLAPDSELLYLHTAHYNPDVESGVAWNDRRIGIPWPLPITDESMLSMRDRGLPPLPSDFAGIST